MKTITDLSPDLPRWLHLLEKLCAIESPSTYAQGINAVSEAAAEELVKLGAYLTEFPNQNYGRNLLATFPDAAGKQSNGILLLCHLDTVHPLGTLKSNPIRVEGNRFYAPGSYDMKASVVQACWALDSLISSGQRPALPVQFLLTCDEEIDSPTSRALIEEYGASASITFCLEPATTEGAIKTRRKGVGSYLLKAHGLAAHAGNEHRRGANAIAALAELIPHLQNLTNYTEGTTTNVGLIRGGSAVNTVPDYCEMEMDIRITSQTEEARLARAMHALRPSDPRINLQVSGGLTRPPMERNALVESAFLRLREIARQTGIELKEASVGGGSDAAYITALGKGALCGMGPSGNGAHTLQEYTDIPSLVERTTLLANALAYWNAP